MRKRSPFRGFKTSPVIIRLAVMLYVRLPLSLRNVGNLLRELGIEVSHETIQFWWHRFGPMLAAEIRRRRIEGLRLSRWRWQLDEMFVRINGEMNYPWRAVDREGEVLASVVTKTCDKTAALNFLRKGCAGMAGLRPWSRTRSNPAGRRQRRSVLKLGKKRVAGFATGQRFHTSRSDDGKGP
jgi:hypothetical protein